MKNHNITKIVNFTKFTTLNINFPTKKDNKKTTFD